MKILCVAEKPSIAKAVAQILSGGAFQASNTRINYIKNYKFTCRHLTAADFDEPYRSWNRCAPVALFEEARIVGFVPDVTTLSEVLTIGIKGDI